MMEKGEKEKACKKVGKCSFQGCICTKTSNKIMMSVFFQGRKRRSASVKRDVSLYTRQMSMFTYKRAFSFIRSYTNPVLLVAIFV